MSKRDMKRLEHELETFRLTEEVSDWLAQKAAKYDWVRRRAFPALYPPLPQHEWWMVSK